MYIFYTFYGHVFWLKMCCVSLRSKVSKYILHFHNNKLALANKTNNKEMLATLYEM